MSLRAVRDTSWVNPFDEKSRRDWIKAYLVADGFYQEDSLDRRYRLSVDGIAKKLHDQNIDEIGEAYFESLCDHAVWMKTYHHMVKFDCYPEWPFKEKPGRWDMSLGTSVNYRQWRLDNEGQGCRPEHEEGAHELSPAIPMDEPLCLVPDFRGNKAMPCLVPIPTMDSRKETREDVCNEKHFTRAIPGLFEVALPTWLYFNRVVVGEGQAVLNEIKQLISPMLTIVWRIVFGKPVSLTIGVDLKYDEFSTSPSIRLEVRRLWDYVCHWVLFATKGDSMTLSDHLVLLLVKEKAGIPLNMYDWETWTSTHLEAMNNLADGERHAQVQHDAEQQLVPELHAILQQPLRVAREYLGVWIRQDKPNADMRLKLAFNYWVRVSIRSGKGVEGVLAWHGALMKELEDEKTLRSSE
ncbi:hypothetical protein FDENT_12695 [Fusarium denticulatum]|uniref:Uncharacterized protein n=1 Tax=Fusarium denticulatum TaxID=48507 RepID=A0A8H5WND6_9HYPO|nr:hypothetical protein FDENT_12695 [Fusarium denticulatum]